MNASLNYGNMSKIFQHINRNQASGKYGGARIRFSTLAEYADHVHSLNLSYPVHRWPEVSLLLPGVHARAVSSRLSLPQHLTRSLKLTDRSIY
jgi:hypothetical protein